jgi:hypothetical protein
VFSPTEHQRGLHYTRDMAYDTSTKPKNEDMSGCTQFKYISFDPNEHYVIRLLTILPKPHDDVYNTSPIRCSMVHVQICKCHLAPGLPEEALTSRFPTVNFHAQVENRPTEYLVTPHALGLKEDAEAGVIPDREDGKPWIKPSGGIADEDLLNMVDLYAEGMAKMVQHPEDIGGGFTIVHPARNEHIPLQGRVAETDSRLRRGLRKVGSRLGLGRKPTPTQQHQPQPFGPKPLRRQAKEQKFTWGNYVALSYEWGNDSDDQEIFIQNCFTRDLAGNPSINLNAPFRPLYIRSNLHAALRRLRLMPQFIDGCRIWADAICINQQSAEERDAQMKIMSDIYQRAGNILVWLGEGNEQLYEALDLVQRYASFYRMEYQEAYDDVHPYLANMHRQRVAVNLKVAMNMFITQAQTSGPDSVMSDYETKLLHDFFSLTYWRRLWMIQELVMGTVDMALVLGDKVTEWRYVRDTAFVLSSISDVFGEAMFNISQVKHTDVVNTVVHLAKIAQLEIHAHRKHIPQTSGMQPMTQLNSGPTAGPERGDVLWQAFRLMTYAKCTNAKDRVFGLLALPCLPNLGIKHDSSKSTVSIYEDFAIGCMNASFRHPLVYLCLIDGATDEIFEYDKDKDGRIVEVGRESLPSWVPNLSSGRETGMIEGIYRAGDKWDPYQHMGFEPMNPQPELSLSMDRKLHVRGFVIDIVDGIGGICPASLGVPDPDSLESRFQHDLTQPSKSPSWPQASEGVTPRAAIAACLTAGTDENGARLRYKDENLALLSSFAPALNSPDMSLHFILANAELRVDGKPLKTFFPNLEDPWAYWNRIDAKTRALRQTMVSRTKRKRLMVTELGFLGLVPNSVSVGDAVIILKGHGRPVVASMVLEKDVVVAYKMKGEAFVEGMMSGEMMEDEYRKDMEDLVFV